MPNVGAVGRERFLTIYNPLNSPGVGWVKLKKKIKVRVSIRTYVPNLGAVRRKSFYPHMRAKSGRGSSQNIFNNR